MRKPTIYEALADRLGRPPTDKECREDVRRILQESLIDRASKGKLNHQRKRSKH